VDHHHSPDQQCRRQHHSAKTITIRAGLTPAAHALVLLHEATHAILHADLARTEYHHRRGAWETEAESAAYVLSRLLGRAPDGSSVPYIAGWSTRDPDAIETTASRVLAAVNTIAAGIGLDESRSPSD
jgi:hypothetical protein